MRAYLKIYSEIGSTPISGRKGNFCDLLIAKTIEVNSAHEAKAKLKELMCNTKYAARGFFFVPEESNQNINKDWI